MAIFSYSPCVFNIPITTTKPHRPPIINELDDTAKPHTIPAAPL